jgi:predicted GNAT superfamily acetyltransferase
LTAYAWNESPVDGDEGSAFIRSTLDTRATIIKQIGVRQPRRGIGRSMYKFFSALLSAPIYMAIVDDPDNVGSKRFHAALGCRLVHTFTTHSDGIARSIYMMPAAIKF